MRVSLPDGTQLYYIVTDLAGGKRHSLARRTGSVGAHCELRYQGQLYDAETGFYYSRHRYYDAESGQYLSPDPIGLSKDEAAGLCSQSIGMG
nr:type IV secretion protein Rhs [Pectobacterium parmentieri]